VLAASTVLILGFEFEARFLCAWFCVVLFLYLMLLGVKGWRRNRSSGPEAR